MAIALKIAIIVMAAVITIPIEYLFFPKLNRQKGKDSVEEKTEEIEKLERMEGIVCLILLIGLSIMISVLSLFVTERKIWYLYLIPMAWPIFWRMYKLAKKITTSGIANLDNCFYWLYYATD